ncbi:MAG TPA: ketosteroid isomerase-related protein [Candidatus Acidoferrum sp.]|nr:ketosteroid isomerase-related protein [Candidatus Acidoferrum sp.]
MSNILERYYQCFNAGDYNGMLELLAEDVVHEPCQGSPRHGKQKFREFLQHMERCYKETVHNPCLFVSTDGKRAAAEFELTGTYLQTDSELPPAQGQTYRLRVGTFFEIDGGRIKRVSNHYNLQDWLRQIGA